MLRFKGADLRPVLREAQANHCRVILVKDQGVYFMSEKGERTREGHHKVLAYAVGCNPDVDSFDQWWNLAETELGGDDFGEYFEIDSRPFARVLESNDDLIITATETSLCLETAKPVPDH
jgi:hypothetical protein